MINRRDFIKLAASITATLSAAKLFQREAHASTSETTGLHNWIMVIDQEKCTGCGYCTLACQAHNDCPPSIEWNKVINFGKVGKKETYISRPCMQCQDAPCVGVCPVKASYQRDDGIIMMDYDRCIGCRYCEIACPYHARAFNWETFDGENPTVPEWGQPEVPRRPRGVVEKCAFCYHRIDRGLQNGLFPGEDDEATPACVVACPVGARFFGDKNDPSSRVNQLLKNSTSFRLREDLGTKPKVYYLPPHEDESL